MRGVLPVVAAAVAAAATLLSAGCGDSTPIRTEARVVHTHVLSRQASQRLLAWFERLRDCYSGRELGPGPVIVTRRRVTVSTDPSVPPSILAGETLSCAEGLGKPPGHASLSTQRGRTALSLPRGELMDAKVVAQAAG